MTDEPLLPRLSQLLPLIREILDGAMREGSYSFGLIADLAAAELVWKLNIFRIIHEIAVLEGGPGRSETKPEEPFKGEVLRGYWHKHFTQASFIAQNVLIEMHRDKTVQKFFAPYQKRGGTITPEMMQELSNRIARENYFRRSEEGRLTGEWIIFSKGEGRNHYITLGLHSAEDDASRAERIERYHQLDKTAEWDWRRSVMTITENPPIPITLTSHS